MFIQEYSNVFPVVRLFRRLLTDGVLINDIPAEVDRMKESGDLKFPNPREQLPEKWWLVELREDTPHGRRLSIVTGDWAHPVDIDPLLILCCERLPPPKAPVAPVAPAVSVVPVATTTTDRGAKPARPMTLREVGIEAALRLVLEAAQWLAPQLSKDSKVDDFKDACLEEFPGLASSTYHKRVWPMARSARGWPAQATPGAKPRK